MGNPPRAVYTAKEAMRLTPWAAEITAAGGEVDGWLCD